MLLQAVNSGLASLTWAQDGFAYAEGYDEDGKRYQGLQTGQIHETAQLRIGLLVKPEVAQQQLDEERTQHLGSSGDGEKGKYRENGEPPIIGEPTGLGGSGETVEGRLPIRFHGSRELDATRVGRDAGQVAEEVISHLSGLVGAEVKVTLEIEANIPAGAPDNVVRTVTENSKTLKFKTHGFEKD